MMIQKQMKFGLATAGLLALGGALIVPQITPASAQTPAPAPSIGRRRGGMEKHPEIRKAIRNLEQAKDSMQRADRDFGGHKAKALDLTQQAIAELRLALQADKH